MAKSCRWIEPKPPAGIPENIPLLLVPVNSRPTITIPTQIIPKTIIIDTQSLQTNMSTNREDKFEIEKYQENLFMRVVDEIHDESRID
ncbi:unnamed protein product [Dracunculus medinensis]|uniref:Uncharacterized protein n=1 Tax=Dracunculus medinensis TaxID=318479 RepID=A0A0N4UC15_DRAME|nr:unnamed protein product [Dracunculus medinensis]